MKLSLSGFGFLLGYIVMVGVASFLEKFSMKQLSPYQINFLGAQNAGDCCTGALDKRGKFSRCPPKHYRRLSKDLALGQVARENCGF